MSEQFFQESIFEAIGLLEESQAAPTEEIKLEKWGAAFDIIEKLTGLLAGLKGREELTFVKLMRSSNEFLQYLRDYEIAKNKSAIALQMQPLAKSIAKQAKEIVSLAKGEELESLSLKYSLGHALGLVSLLEQDNSPEKKVREIVLEHYLVSWEKKEAKEFARLMSYINYYLACLRTAKITKDIPAAIKQLRRANIFGVLIVKQAEKLAALL